eukprot:599434-Rhodomonas_salina.2
MLGVMIQTVVAQLIGYESPQYITVTFEDAAVPAARRQQPVETVATKLWQDGVAHSWLSSSRRAALDIALLKVVVMNTDHMYVVANRLWSIMATDELTSAMAALGVTVQKGYVGEMIGIDDFGNLISLAEYMQTPRPISACQGIEYHQEFHDFFCESNYALLGFVQGDASSSAARREGCESLDGCCFLAAENATTSLVDMCRSCEDCHGGSWPCASCCWSTPQEPADQGAECNEQIDSYEASPVDSVASQAVLICWSLLSLAITMGCT